MVTPPFRSRSRDQSIRELNLQPPSISTEKLCDPDSLCSALSARSIWKSKKYLEVTKKFKDGKKRHRSPKPKPRRVKLETRHKTMEYLTTNPSLDKSIRIPRRLSNPVDYLEQPENFSVIEKHVGTKAMSPSSQEISRPPEDGKKVYSYEVNADMMLQDLVRSPTCLASIAKENKEGELEVNIKLDLTGVTCEKCLYKALTNPIPVPPPIPNQPMAAAVDHPQYQHPVSGQVGNNIPPRFSIHRPLCYYKQPPMPEWSLMHPVFASMVPPSPPPPAAQLPFPEAVPMPPRPKISGAAAARQETPVRSIRQQKVNHKRKLLKKLEDKKAREKSFNNAPQYGRKKRSMSFPSSFEVKEQYKQRVMFFGFLTLFFISSFCCLPELADFLRILTWKLKDSTGNRGWIVTKIGLLACHIISTVYQMMRLPESREMMMNDASIVANKLAEEAVEVVKKPDV